MKEQAQADIHSCKNCRYFSQHYSKQGKRFKFVCCGHCMNSNNSNSTKNQKGNPHNLCEFWEEDVKDEKQIRSIKATLEFMANILSELTIMLASDDEV